MDIAIFLRSLFRGVYVGSDKAGNRYYRDRHWWFGTRLLERRWVVYADELEASLVPAAWHGWLHHTTDDIPSEGSDKTYSWMKDHQANQTGTPNAWKRRGSLRDEHRREDATGDYQAWVAEDYS